MRPNLNSSAAATGLATVAPTNKRPETTSLRVFPGVSMIFFQSDRSDFIFLPDATSARDHAARWGPWALGVVLLPRHRCRKRARDCGGENRRPRAIDTVRAG